MSENGPSVSRAVLYRVVELVFKGGLKTQTIADQINHEFPGVHVNRQSIYKLLAEAKEFGLLRVVAPFELELESLIRKEFKIPQDEVKNITVVDCPNPENSDAVSAAAADVALELIKRIGTRRGGAAVGLGLGPGRATLSFSQSISNLIKQDPLLPKLNLFGISAGCVHDAPQFAPVSFFNLFPEEKVEKRLALFAQALVLGKEFERIKSSHGVKEVFEAKDGIDIVVTSMGNMIDEHTLYRVFMDRCYPDLDRRPTWLADCVGDVQYRPFSKSAPLHEGPNDYRLVTLFELEELVTMARDKGKYVVLIARQCGLCKTQMTRAKALMPLMANPKLRLFSHVVMDSPTAKELLIEARQTKPGLQPLPSS